MAAAGLAVKITDEMSTAEAAKARKPLRRAVIASVGKAQERKKQAPPTAEQIALAKQTIRAEIEDLDSRAKQAWQGGSVAEGIAEATAEQIAILSALKAKRDERKAAEMAAAVIKAEEDAIAAPLKEWLRANNKTMIRAAGLGRFCRELKAAGVSLREPSESFTLRS